MPQYHMLCDHVTRLFAQLRAAQALPAVQQACGRYARSLSQLEPVVTAHQHRRQAQLGVCLQQLCSLCLTANGH